MSRAAGQRQTSQQVSRFAGLLLLFLFVVGCAEKIPSTPQRDGDSVAGYDLLINGGYVTCGMPYSAWKRATGSREQQGPTLPGRSGRNSEMPYHLTVHEDERGVEIVSTNCLLCHATLINGELVIGVGNESLDFTGDPREFVDTVGTFVSGKNETAAWSKWAQRIDAMVPYAVTDTVGVNPAPNLTLALIAHRDPRTLEWFEEPRMAPPPDRPLPTSVPPWWNMGKKHALFYNAMGRGDHARFMMMKSLVCTDNIDEAEKLDEDFTDIRAYIASLKPPAYPFPVDAGLASQGRSVFERRCAKCHGTYGPDGSYPNLVVGLGRVGTDPLYAERAYKESGRFMSWFNRSWFGDIARAQPGRGYIAPPLDGVWATAPYLHNGSVPTIEALLNGDIRPKYWTRDRDSRDYDPGALGWKYTGLDHGKDGAGDPEERKRIYDTTLPGYSNAGHTFGDKLHDTERRAVIEYLKTLDGS